MSIFNHETTSANEGEYIDQTIVINSRVSFANDRPSGNILTAPSVDAGNLIYMDSDISPFQSNIKFISVNLRSVSGVEELDKNITLNAFSCNIGTYTIGESQF